MYNDQVHSLLAFWNWAIVFMWQMSAPFLALLAEFLMLFCFLCDRWVYNLLHYLLSVWCWAVLFFYVTDECTITRMSLLLTRFFYKMWFFGAAYYFLTWAFLGVSKVVWNQNRFTDCFVSMLHVCGLFFVPDRSDHTSCFDLQTVLIHEHQLEL